MLAHFAHPAVWISYIIVALVSLFGFEYFENAPALVAVGAGMSIFLVVVDYVVHCAIHNWMRLRFPARSLLWAGAMGVTLWSGLVVAGWQLVGMYLAQAVWDNSWHAHSHHHEEDEPRAELDHSYVRWGAGIMALSFVAVSKLL